MATTPLTLNSHQLGGLQPLLGDLLTTNTPANRFQQQTYSIDPTQMQERLGQYNVYDRGALGGLADYFGANAAATNGNNLYLKQEDFDKLSGNLAGIDASQASQMAPMLGGLSALASSGNLNFYDKTALNSELGKYGQVDISGITIPGMEKYNPVATVDGHNYYNSADAQALLKGLSGYSSLSQDQLTKYADSLKGVTASGTLNGKNLYQRSAVDPILSKEAYNALLGQDAYKLNKDYLAGPVVAPTAHKLPTDYWQPTYTTDADGGQVITSSLGDRLANDTRFPQKRDPALTDKLIGQILSGYQPDAQTVLTSVSRPDEVISHNPAYSATKKGFNSVYLNNQNRDLMQNVGKSLGLSNDEVRKVAGLVSANMYEDAAGTKAPFAMGSTSVKPYSEALLNYAENKYGTTLSQDIKDKVFAGSGQIDTYYHKLRNLKDPKEGLLSTVFGFLDPILDDIDPMHNTAQDAVVDLIGADTQQQAFSTIMPIIVDAFFPGAGAAISGADAATRNDWGGVGNALLSYGVSSALSSYGAPAADSTASSTGTAAEAGTTAASTGSAAGSYTGSVALDKALIKAVGSAAGNAAQGKGWNDILTNAALSGVGSYLGDSVGGMTKGTGALGQLAGNVGTNSLMSGLGSYMNGGGFGRGASLGALGGLTSAAGKALGSYIPGSSAVGGVLSGVTNSYLRNYLSNKLYNK